MESDELQRLISKTAAVMERHQQLCAQMQQQQGQFCQDLHAITTALPQRLERSAHSATEQLGRDGAASLQRSLLGCEQQLAASSAQISHASTQLAQTLRRLQKASHGLIWMCLGSGVAAVLVLLVGSIWLGGHYRSELQRNQLQLELLRAYNRADVALCGDGQLCANVDPRAAGQGDQGRYRPVRPRP